MKHLLKYTVFCLFLSSCTNWINSDSPFVTLSSITITPSDASIMSSTTQQFTATGTYSNGSTADITLLVTWTCDNLGAATIATNGLATGTGTGLATITATLENKVGSAFLSVVGLWTRLSGSADVDTVGRGIVVDSSNNSYVTGYTEGALDGESLTGVRDLFVIKYNISGQKQWTKLLGVAGVNTEGSGIALDQSENIYVTGYTEGSLGGESLTGTKDLFIVKYNVRGVKQWTKLLGVSGENTEGEGVAVDTLGNIYVTGYTTGNLDKEVLTGIQDVFVVKYNSSGVKQWTKLLGAEGASTGGKDIAVDSAGNSYVTGYVHSVLVWGPGLDGEAIAGVRDTFLIKYSTSGVKQWTKLSGAVDADTYGEGVAVDSAGYIYIAGDTNGALDGEPSFGVYSTALIKYNSSGVKQWTKLSGAPGSNSFGLEVATDTSNNIYLTGYTDGDLDGESLTGVLDAVVIKYNSSGVKQWTKLSGVSGKNTLGNGIVINSSDKSYVTGSSTGNLDGELLTGTMDLFVTTKFNQ